MINTMSKLITTNVRLNQEDLIRAKNMASEMGMSFNAYINWLVKDWSRKMMAGKPEGGCNKKLADIAKDAKKIKSQSEEKYFSDDDKIIYG
jgi:hypothetical protein